MKAREIRKKYIDFFIEKGHKQIPSAPLLPENDPTVLFTTAGMHPLVPYLLGEPHPLGKRLVNHQKCVRTGDIDEVGDETHLTFFEMMGNWSLGNYFKKEAIEWSFEFLTDQKWLDISIEKLAITCFGGDDDAPRDDDAAKVWKSLGIPDHKITYLSKKDNWWGPAGQTGPCGPDTEMFYWVGKGAPPESSNPGNDEENWIEIWNDVFMQYFKKEDGSFEELKQKNVDTGLGLERVTAVLQGKNNVYETELFTPILKKIEAISNKKYTDEPTGFRIIADHIRTATMMAGDGVHPSNVDQGYIMRRLIRRAIRWGKKLDIPTGFTATIAKKVIHTLVDIYPELQHEEEIIKIFQSEEEQFEKTIHTGLRELKKLIKKKGHEMDNTVFHDLSTIKKESDLHFNVIDGKDAFYIYETYGFPLEMIEEELAFVGIAVNINELRELFHKSYKQHQETSRAGAEQKFAGGLADHSEECKRLHTATHLVHQALRDVLGDHVYQKGSNITHDRLRFDFNHDQKMTLEQIKEVEDIVNEQIKRDLPIHYEMMNPNEAKTKGVIGVFDDKYAELGGNVKVYMIGDYSKEICGGPHMEHTGQLGAFKITKEQASSAGIRRIKAIVKANTPEKFL